MPAVAEAEGKSWRMALVVELGKLWLIIFFKERDRAGIRPEEPDVPMRGLVEFDRYARLVLDDCFTVG